MGGSWADARNVIEGGVFGDVSMSFFPVEDCGVG